MHWWIAEKFWKGEVMGLDLGVGVALALSDMKHFWDEKYFLKFCAEETING